MLKTILISVAILALCMVFLAIKLLFKKDGRFPNTHVGGSRAMRQRGIGCVQSQDFEARLDNPHRVSER